MKASFQARNISTNLTRVSRFGVRTSGTRSFDRSALIGDGVTSWRRSPFRSVVQAQGRKGRAYLSNHRDYNQLVKHVNSICPAWLVVTSFHDRTFSRQPLFFFHFANSFQSLYFSQQLHLSQLPHSPSRFPIFSLFIEQRQLPG